MKLLKLILLLCLGSHFLFAQPNSNIAMTPPMGWNSYNSFGSAVHEDEVKSNAD